MAEGSFSVDQFMCSVCLDLLKDPVALHCGHSYCMRCITDCWDQDDLLGIYSCPQCRQTFTPRPVLSKNTVLAEVIEKLIKTKLKPAVSACYAGAGDVECDVCTGRKHKAVKSCLVCLESYCQTHFEHHEEFHSGNRHKTVNATRRLQELICPQHQKLLEVFCRTDQQCICMMCMMGEHRKHNTVLAAAQRTDKETHVKDTQRKFQQRIQQRQKDLQDLRDAVKSHKRCAQAAVDDSEKIFTELISSIERRRSEVIQLIRDQEKAAVSRAEGVLKRLEQEIDDLRTRDVELEKLLHTDDHNDFLQNFQSLCAPPESTDTSVTFLFSFDALRESVCQLRDKLQDFYTQQMRTISDTHTTIEPRDIRDQFLQYSHQLTLDLNTMNEYLRLSDGNRVITCTDTHQQYPAHPDRFDWCQVLCRESVCARSYWEIEWSGKGVYISVSYKNIRRKEAGNECLFGCNDQSWSLFCSDGSYSFCHNDVQTDLPVVCRSDKIGVYVDHSAGILSFYSVSDTMTLIHSIHTTFNQPLYPGFRVGYKSSVKLCDLSV